MGLGRPRGRSTGPGPASASPQSLMSPADLAASSMAL